MLVDAQLLSQLHVYVVLNGSIGSDVELSAMSLVSVLLRLPALVLALGGDLEDIRVHVASQERSGACFGVQV